MPITEKGLYEYVGSAVQYHLSWRERLLAGYVAVVAGLALTFSWMQSNHKSISFLVPLVASAMSIVFWLLDRRNREIFKNCIQAGADLESAASLKGVYTALAKESKVQSHSVVLSGVFWIAATLFFGCAVGRNYARPRRPA
jgi:hypothetical protein